MYQELFELVESVGKLNDKVEKIKELKEDVIIFYILYYYMRNFCSLIGLEQ